MKLLEDYIIESTQSSQTFKNVYEMTRHMNLFLNKIDINPFVKILGKTKYESNIKSRHMNVGSGIFHDWDCKTWGYLSTSMGDYLEFANKPTKEQLDECSELLKKQLEEKGFIVIPVFKIADYNPYYQSKGTFGIKISINITKNDWNKTIKLKNK